MKRIFISILISISITISIGIARIINVPEDQRFIQGGIDAANNGDTVLVQPGEYVENLQIIQKTVTLLGDRSDPASVIIDGSEGGDRGSVLITQATDNEPSGIVILGLTLAHGTGNGREGDRYGGGILSNDDGNNRLIVEDCIIKQNHADIGAAFCGTGAMPIFSRVQFLENSIGNGSIVSIAYSGLIDDQDVRPFIKHSLFTGNSCGQAVINCVYNGVHLIRIDHCTIVENQCQSGAMVVGSTRAVITNNIIWNNASNRIIGGNEDQRYLVEFQYSDIEGGRNYVEGRIEYGDGNLNTNPLFADPDNGDYHLTADSPCIDAGDPDSPEDPDGTRSDMGAFYFQQNAAPIIIAEIENISVDEDCGYLAIADLDTIFSDQDGDTLQFEYESLEPLGLTLDGGNVLGLNPQENFFGDSLIVIITASDRDNRETLQLLVTINPVNDAPTISELIAPGDNFEMMYDDTITFAWSESIDPDLNENVRYLFHLELWDWFTETTIEESCVLDVGAETGLTIPDPSWEVTWPNYGCVQAPYTWWTEAISGEDTTRSDSTFSILVYGSGDVKERSGLAESLTLLSAFPNPFNSTTTIRFQSPHAIAGGVGGVSLRIYDLSGHLVTDLTNSAFRTPHSAFGKVVWDAGSVGAGVYFVRLEAGVEVRTQKIVLMR